VRDVLSFDNLSHRGGVGIDNFATHWFGEKLSRRNYSLKLYIWDNYVKSGLYNNEFSLPRLLRPSFDRYASDSVWWDCEE
jgi:hypothetical protein